jgi:hypothetical protein
VSRRILVPEINDDTTEMLQRFALNRVSEKLPSGWRLTEVDLGKPIITPGVCARFEVEFQFEYTERSEHRGSPCAREVIRFLEALDYFGGAEDRKDYITIDGNKWLLGDGDDSGAVWQTGENRYAIWLRWFGE